MPELPEVETVAARLREVLVNQTITGLEVLNPKSFSGEVDQVIGKTITAVERRAKNLSLVLSNDLVLLTHLKMTGQLIYVSGERRLGGGHPTADWIYALPSAHTRIHYRLSSGDDLFFNDMRKFGWMRLVERAVLEKEWALLGPDINSPHLTRDYLIEQFGRRRVPIKQVLMEPKVVGGIGNIYACDGLNKARISPFRPAHTLTSVETEQVMITAREVIGRAIELGGTTFDGKYVGSDGLSGGYQNETLAYGREGLPCYNCGRPIAKDKLAGRGTYYCPHCQI